MEKVDSPHTKYLILYALIVTPIVISFFFIRRSSQKPVRLKFEVSEDKKNEKSMQVRSAWTEDTQPGFMARVHRPTGTRTEYRPRASGPGAYWSNPTSDVETSLNVFFNWNGHSWDAYEVFGLPAGSSRESVTAAYNSAMEKADDDSLPFYQAAYDAIMKSRTPRS